MTSRRDRGYRNRPADSVTPQNLSTWNTARLAAPVSGADIVCITDSIGVLGSVTQRPFPWIIGRALSAFDARAQTYGMLFANASAGAPQMDSCAGSLTANGLGGYSVDMAVNDTAQVVATCDGISIVWTRAPAGGSIEVRDGGSGGTLITTINTAGTAAASQRTVVDLTTYASHTIHLKCVTAGVRFETSFLHAGDQTAGTRVWVAGHAGYTTAQFLANTSLGLDFIDNINPALTIIATGFNDASAATYESDLGLLIDAVRARTPGDVMIVATWWGSNLTVSAAKTAAAQRVATAKSCNLVDVASILGSVADNVDPYSQSDDGAHPTPGASALYADLILAEILGDPVSVALTTLERGPRAIQGTIVNDQGVRGAAMVDNVLTYPAVRFAKTFGDANDELVLIGSALSAILGRTGPTIGGGAGGASALSTFLTFATAGALIGNGSLTLQGTAGAGFLDLTEQSADPSAPAANGVRIFAKDNGAGKTQLYARFNTGGIVLIATQP